MMFNAIKTEIPCIYIYEEIDGFKVVEFYGDDLEVLAKTKTMAQAREFIKSLH